MRIQVHIAADVVRDGSKRLGQGAACTIQEAVISDLRMTVDQEEQHPGLRDMRDERFGK